MERNPYSPPQSAVDAVPQAVPAGVHSRQIGYTVALLWLALILGIIQGVVAHYKLPPSARLPAWIWIPGVIGSLLFYSWIIGAIRKGRNWARVTYLVLVLLRFSLAWTQSRILFVSSILEVTIVTAYYLTQLAALYLLFTDPVRSVFTRSAAKY
jgi:hypothetical protein